MGRCRKTRKSTSGGAILIGNHCIRSWSKTQAIIATSSGEAELYGSNKTTSECLGMQSLAEDFGDTMQVQVLVDASAALGIIRRRGLGKTRHIRVQELWCQELSSSGRVKFLKVNGKRNPADMMTKCIDERGILKNTYLLHLQFRIGRSSTAPEIS